MEQRFTQKEVFEALHKASCLCFNAKVHFDPACPPLNIAPQLLKHLDQHLKDAAKVTAYLIERGGRI